MVLEVLWYGHVLKGLKNLSYTAYSMRENLDARVKFTYFLFDVPLDSKTMNLYGGINQDKRHRFKIDHDFDLSKLIKEEIIKQVEEEIIDTIIGIHDVVFPIDENTYMKSQGTEFIIIPKTEIEGAKCDYSIRADKYNNIREELNKGNYGARQLEKTGGFKIGVVLKPGEISLHDGWKELNVRKNGASEQDYEEASRFLGEEYVPEAQKRGCFSDGEGMRFRVDSDKKTFEVEPWLVLSSGINSNAGTAEYSFTSDTLFRDGNFLWQGTEESREQLKFNLSQDVPGKFRWLFQRAMQWPL